MPNRPTLSSPEQSRRCLIPFAPLVAKEIRTRLDPGLGLDFECKHGYQNDGVARVIEDLIDIVSAVDCSSNKTSGLGKYPFRGNDSRFLRRHAGMDSLPGVAERCICA